MRMYIHGMGRIEATPRRARPDDVRRARPMPADTGPVPDHADGAHARAAAAVGNAEGLVQVQVADVGADVAGPAEADLGVHVGAVHVDLAAVAVDDFGRSRLMFSSNTPCVDG